jgi:hypothetical protein
MKTLAPDWIRIWIGIQPKMLDPESMNPHTMSLLIISLYES